MSMSTHVVGFKPADEKWLKMKAVWDSCVAAGIDPPNNVLDFFGHEPPDDQGVEVALEKHTCVQRYSSDKRGHDGFEIDVRKLPPDVTIIRLYNSY